MVHLILWILALICFGLAAIGVRSDRIDLVALGLAFAALTHVIPN